MFPAAFPASMAAFPIGLSAIVLPGARGYGLGLGVRVGGLGLGSELAR